MTISEKPGGAAKAGGPAAAGGPASLLAVTSSKLPTREDGARWKDFWRAYLAGF